MKTFHCQHCGQPVFFENVECLRCHSTLAFVPERLQMAAIEPWPARPTHWRERRAGSGERSEGCWRLCRNHRLEACNFAVPAADSNPYCVSCRQTRTRPDLQLHLTSWQRIEAAKRRLYYTLAQLGLVQALRLDGSRDGPVFDLLADQPGQPVTTGHANGVITLNVAEADDAERVRRRVALHEPYRTLLGHLRHESGHYYWEVLVRDAGRTANFRAVFGDESADYAQALAAHYAQGGPPVGWAERHVSAYATAHPWEDWAETWAHYLHMVDLLETAASYDARLTVPGDAAGGEVENVVNPYEGRTADFDELVQQWVPITLLLNSLNRSLGQDDAYPFALSPAALEKLRFVHDLIQGARQGPPTARHAPA